MPNTSTLVLVGLRNPVADRLRSRPELLGETVGIPPSTNQIDHLAPECRLMRNMGFRHDDTFRESVRGVHQSGSIPIPRLQKRGSELSREQVVAANLFACDWDVARYGLTGRSAMEAPSGRPGPTTGPSLAASEQASRPSAIRACRTIAGNEAEPLFEHIVQAKSDPEMVKLAVQLIDRQTSAYNPSDLEDRYETRLRAMLDAKAQGAEIQGSPPAPPTDNIIDLMAALRNSLKGAPGRSVEASLAKPKASGKRAQKAAEETRKQPGLKLPIEGGRKRAAKEAAPAPVVEQARRSRRKAS